MEQVLIAKYHLNSSSGNFPSEEIRFNYGKITLTYTQQKRTDGIAAGSVSSGWDLISNKVA
jgi:type VI secretion system secreted protein Hcp